MKANINSILAMIAGGIVLALGAAAATSAIAGCNCPPPCCSPPVPPTPPSFPCCQPPINNVIIPGVEIVVAPSVVVNAQVQAQAQAAGVAAAGTAVLVGGGGNAGFNGAGPAGVIQNLIVDNGGIKRTAYEAERTKIKKVIIEVFCIDDKDVPHPGSQVTPDRDINDAYDGELFRCIAGTHLRATLAEYTGQIAFDHGWTMDCDKGHALYHAPGGHVECRLQTPARDCNERSLLRRFGAGIKILTMITVERYTAYREETIQGASTVTSMTTDGGVGGVMY